MKTLAIIAVLAASVAAPAFAQSALENAVRIDNRSADNASEQTVLPVTGLTLGTTVSTRGASALQQALAIGNASADNAGDEFDSAFVTTFSGTSSIAADIFARFEAADDES